MNPLAILTLLRKHTRAVQRPLVDTVIKEYGKDPYLILISCLLSLRAKDVMTIHVCRDLFARVCTPEQLYALPVAELERIIFRTGFYHTKARVLRHVTNELLVRDGGHVPRIYEQLIAIKGIGPKTANLVLGYAFGVPAICVDVHVHRLSNRLGLVRTTTPDQTEAALRCVFAQRYWIELNSLLVMWGQNICGPLRPKCSECCLVDVCPKIGVKKSR